MSTTTVVEETARQVRAQIGRDGVELIAIDEKTLRVSLAKREPGDVYHNVDISYDAGRDLYDVAVHTMDRVKHEHETKTVTGLYFDQLGDLLSGRFSSLD